MAKPRKSNPPAPDPADVYERSNPDHESGMGRLDNNTEATPTDSPDQIEKTTTNRQDGERQINSEHVVDERKPKKLRR